MDLCPGCDRPEDDHEPRCIFLSFKGANRPSAFSDGLVLSLDNIRNSLKKTSEDTGFMESDNPHFAGAQVVLEFIQQAFNAEICRLKTKN